MKDVLRPIAFFALLCAGAAHAQLYKWVGPDGKVGYSDTPPPSSARQVETRSLTIGGVSAAEFPYELAEALRAHPVTLYTTSNCLPCDDGRKLLVARGIPHTEKTVNSNEDIVQFRQLAGDSQLPFLTVGKYREKGFEAGAWHNALNIAGYPEKSRLPRHYRNPAAQAAAPTPPAPDKPQVQPPRAVSRPPATELPPPIGNAPPGFRF